MPRPRKDSHGIMGLWSALQDSNLLLCAMLRNVLPMHHRHNKPRLRLIRCYSWRVYSTLSTFASLCLYNTTLFSPKTCKVSNKKSWPLSRPTSRLCSQLLVAHDTYKTVLTRKLCGEVQELGAYAVDCALVHPVLLPRPHRRVSIVVVPHRPSFIRIAIIIRASDDAQPSLRPAQCPPVVKCDSFKFRRQPYSLLRRWVVDECMSATPAAMSARL